MATRTKLADAFADAVTCIVEARRQEAEYPTRDIDAALRSAVRAVLPGRQQRTNLTPVMDAARKAFIRTLRRRAK